IPVILDGTFAAADQVQKARATAGDPRCLWLAIECVCPPEVARERMARRLAEGHDASEAQPELHDVQQLRWGPWPTDLPQFRVATTRPIEEQTQAVLARLRSLVAAT